MAGKASRRYRPTESKYKDGAKEMYITYDLEQQTRGVTTATYPKVRRVYIAGRVKDWETGQVEKRSGRRVHGMAITYEQSRAGYGRREFTARRGGTRYRVKPAAVEGSSQEFRKVVEIPKEARNVRFHTAAEKLPKKYRSALQDVS